MADKVVIGNFLEEIYKSAEQRCAEEIEKIKEYREESIKKMKETADIEAEHDYQSEMHKVELSIAAEFSRRESKLRAELFRQRETITSEVFAEVEKKLADYTSCSDYAEMLKKDAASFSEALPEGETVISMRSADGKYETDVKAAFGRPCDVVFSDKIKIGGLSATSGIVSVDNTLDTRLLEQREYFIKNSGLKVV